MVRLKTEKKSGFNRGFEPKLCVRSFMHSLVMIIICWYITNFINSSRVIFERNMRVVNFWTMCHHSLGHEKKPLLTAKDPLKSLTGVCCLLKDNLATMGQETTFASIELTFGFDRMNSRSKQPSIELTRYLQRPSFHPY